MRRSLLMAMAIVASAQPSAGAQEAHEIVIGGGASPAAAFESCVEVEIGGHRTFSCLNQMLKNKVGRTSPGMNLPPVDAKSSDIRLGIVNVPGVQQQYGKNFGASVIPFRPAPPAYASPVGRR